jgi:AcrR family transcriptional regulator
MGSTSQSRPRTKSPAERRDELLDAAQRLFLRHGVGLTTIEQITQAANVAKGTFYLHFSSKEEIRLALGERFAEQHLATIKAATSGKPGDDWPGKLASWAMACVAGYLDAIQLHDALFYGAGSPTREGLVDNVVIDHLAELLQAGNEAQAWSVNDPRLTAVFLFSGIHAAVDDAYLRQKRINRARLARTLQQLFLRTAGVLPGSSG